ncbi:hypothetical protein C3Y87_12135 [Carbonactinospora thermoautotrophica]|uniref:WD40 repeat domain-containing protein n=2 Tax=Carbonactinospora thermoautotrophica TaxID=1469144 RepID=UPI00226FD890|nr:WD40 repeat domain-containing protein [Carbonactinospora thermoautotrophica]MCX9192150.1 hypothetical protein [Carbonactinospora thermoautotrophica]
MGPLIDAVNLMPLVRLGEDVRPLAVRVRERVAHHLRTKPVIEHAAYARLAALQLGQALRAEAPAGDAAWWPRWAWSRHIPTWHVVTSVSGVLPSIALTLDRCGRPLAVTAAWDRGPTAHDLLTGVLTGAATTSVGGSAVAAACLPDGSLLAAVAGTREVRLFDLRSNRALARVDAPEDELIGALALNCAPDGRLFLAAAASDGPTRVWELGQDLDVARTLTLNSLVQVKALDVRVLSSGRPVLAAGDDTGVTRVWDLEADCLLGVPLRWPGAQIRGVALRERADERWALAVTDMWGHLVAWDLGRDAAWDAHHARLLRQPVPAHQSALSNLAMLWLDDERLALASVTVFGKIYLWYPADHGAPKPVSGSFGVSGQRAVEPGDGHPPLAHALTVVDLPRFGRVLMTCDEAGRIRLFDADTGTAHGVFTSHGGPFNQLAAGRTGDGRPILAASGDGAQVQVWDPARGPNCLLRIRHAKGYIAGLAVAERPGRPTVIVSADSQGHVRVSDPLTGRAARRGWQLPKDAWIANLAVVSLPDGTTAVMTSERSGVLRTWSLDTGKQIAEPVNAGCEQSRHLTAGTLPAGKPVVVTSGRQKTLQAWLFENGAWRRGWARELPDDPAEAVVLGTLSDGDPILLSVHHAGAARIWAAESGELLHTIELGASFSTAVFVRPGRVALAGEDSGVLTLDLYPGLAGRSG